jgi:uncharacterized phage infection (PIP) family protein YhgE
MTMFGRDWHASALAAVLAIMVVAATAPAMADTTTADVAKELRDVVEAAKAYGHDRKQEYETKLEGALDKLDERVTELKAKARQAAAAAKDDLTRSVADLEKKSAEARKRLEALRGSSARAWEDLKTGTAQVVDDLSQTYDKVRSRF